MMAFSRKTLLRLLALGIVLAGVGCGAQASLLASCPQPDGYNVNTEELCPGEVILGARGYAPSILETTGYADIENHVAMTERSVVRIASLTKQFTAVAVLALHDDGMLNFEDAIGSHLPNLPEDWREITVEQLLSHTSGLPSDMSPVLRRMRDDLAPEELIGLFFNEPLRATPGEAWSYSNLNYWVLGVLVERVTDLAYEAFISQRVLSPASLEATRYGNSREIISGRASGYERDSDGRLTNARYFSSSLGYAAGGFVSTPLDMMRWYASLSRGEIISASTLSRAITAVVLNDGSSSGYGFGWYIDEIEGMRVAHHGGSSIGFGSYVYWVPGEGYFAASFHNWYGPQGEPRSETLSLLRRLMKEDQ